LAVRDFVVTTGPQRFLVMKLFRGESAVAVVRAPTGRAFTGSVSTLSREVLNRIWKRQMTLLASSGLHQMKGGARTGGSNFIR
jgi:hypothetical protein